MSRQLKNRIKGFILLLVFSMNTLAGFACSTGMDIGYNKGHHQHVSEQIDVQMEHHHDHHSKTPEKNQKETGSKQDDSKDCCGDITKLNLADKSITSNASIQAQAFLIAFVSQFILPEFYAPSFPDNTTSYALRRSWDLNDHTDLRIVIQSFQI